jgi:hypothetical protein
LQTKIEINGRLLPVISLYIVGKGQAEKELIESTGNQHPRSIKDIETVMKRVTLFNHISDDMSLDVGIRSRAVFQRDFTHLITQTEADLFVRYMENNYRDAVVAEIVMNLGGVLDLSDTYLIKSETMNSEKLRSLINDLIEICESKIYGEFCDVMHKNKNAAEGNSRNVRTILGHLRKEKVVSKSEARTLETYFMRYHNDAFPPGLLKSVFRHIEKKRLIIQV